MTEMRTEGKGGYIEAFSKPTSTTRKDVIPNQRNWIKKYTLKVSGIRQD